MKADSLKLKVSWESTQDGSKLGFNRLMCYWLSKSKKSRQKFLWCATSRKLGKAWKECCSWIVKFEKSGLAFPPYHWLGLWLREINGHIWVSIFSSVQKFNGEENSALYDYAKALWAVYCDGQVHIDACFNASPSYPRHPISGSFDSAANDSQHAGAGNSVIIYASHEGGNEECR